MKWPFSLFYISIQKKLIECSGLWLLSFNVKWGLCTISKFCLDILLIVVSYTYYVAQSRESTFFWLWGLPVYNISIHHSVETLEKFTIPVTSLWTHQKSNRNPIKLSKKTSQEETFYTRHKRCSKIFHNVFRLHRNRKIFLKRKTF